LTADDAKRTIRFAGLPFAFCRAGPGERDYGLTHYDLLTFDLGGADDLR